MSERDLSLEVRLHAYAECLGNGLCPHTLRPCDRVRLLERICRVASEALATVDIVARPDNELVAQQYYEITEMVRNRFDVALADSKACQDGCAIPESDPPDFKE